MKSTMIKSLFDSVSSFCSLSLMHFKNIENVIGFFSDFSLELMLRNLWKFKPYLSRWYRVPKMFLKLWKTNSNPPWLINSPSPHLCPNIWPCTSFWIQACLDLFWAQCFSFGLRNWPKPPIFWNFWSNWSSVTKSRLNLMFWEAFNLCSRPLHMMSLKPVCYRPWWKLCCGTRNWSWKPSGKFHVF